MQFKKTMAAICCEMKRRSCSYTGLITTEIGKFDFYAEILMFPP